MNNHDVMTAVLLKESIRTYIIRWNVTSLCNYNCSFCIQGNKKAHAEHAKGESAELRWRISLGIRNIIEKINSENFTAIRLFLIGGEVTILPELPELIANIINMPFQGEIAVHITTNLSADQDYYDHLLAVFKKTDYAGKRSLHIGASFYKDYTTLQTICGKLEYIRNHSQIDRTRRRDKVLNLLRKKKVIQKEHFCTASIGIPLISDEDFYEFLNTKKGWKKHVLVVIQLSYVIIQHTLQTKYARKSRLLMTINRI
jgi:organic radical activating enzyme